jgi:hypothetical protein
MILANVSLNVPQGIMVKELYIIRICSEQIHSSMETKVLEEYVHSFTSEKDKVF